MYRSWQDWEDNPLIQFCGVVMGVIGFIGGIIALVVAVVFACYYLFDGPTCRARGPLMGAETYWSFRTGCMVQVTGSNVFLPWSEIVPVERDGKIVYAPKPYTVKLEK